MAGWQFLLLFGLSSMPLIFLAGYAASSRVEIVQFIATGRTGSITQYTGCEATDPITLPSVTILAPNADTDLTIAESSRMRLSANVTADYHTTPHGLEILVRQGVDGDLIESWEDAAPANAEPVAFVETGSRVHELPSGSRILIAADKSDFTVASRGVIEIGGLNGQAGAGARLSSEAQVTAIESPYIGSERVRFVDEKVEPFSIIYSHPELIIPDDALSGGYRKAYDKLLAASCADPGDDRRQPLAFFAFGTSATDASDEPDARLLAVSMMRRTDAIGLATMGEVTPVSGLPKLIQVSSWSRVVKSPALQAAFAMAATLVTIGGLIASILALRKEEEPAAPSSTPVAAAPPPPAQKRRRQPPRKAETKSETGET